MTSTLSNGQCENGSGTSLVDLSAIFQVALNPMKKILLIIFMGFFSGLSYSQTEAGCKRVVVVKPSPFVVSGGEFITLSDGTVWQDQTYLYLYLYLSSPTVIICPDQKIMYLPKGDDFTRFFLRRVK
jgi:hypothetical protein